VRRSAAQPTARFTPPGPRGPDDDLRLQFEAVSQFDASEKKILKALLDSLILKHQARRWASAS